MSCIRMLKQGVTFSGTRYNWYESSSDTFMSRWLQRAVPQVCVFFICDYEACDMSLRIVYSNNYFWLRSSTSSLLHLYFWIRYWLLWSINYHVTVWTLINNFVPFIPGYYWLLKPEIVFEITRHWMSIHRY